MATALQAKPFLRIHAGGRGPASKASDDEVVVTRHAHECDWPTASWTGGRTHEDPPTILIVEDDQTLRDCVSAALEQKAIGCFRRTRESPP